METITEHKFKKIFPYSYLENNKYRITVAINNLEHVVFDKLRKIAIFYKMGDLSQNENYSAPKGTIEMVEQFRTQDLKELKRREL